MVLGGWCLNAFSDQPKSRLINNENLSRLQKYFKLTKFEFHKLTLLYKGQAPTESFKSDIAQLLPIKKRTCSASGESFISHCSDKNGPEESFPLQTFSSDRRGI